MRKLIFILVLVALFFNVGTSQQLVDGIAAVVGDDIVLISQINTLITQYAFQNKIDIAKQPQLYAQLGEQFLNSLIDEKILLVKADEDTIEADASRIDQTVRQQLDYMIEQAGSQQKLEEYYSAPLYKIKKDIRTSAENQMRIGILREKRFGLINISRKEVEKFYSVYEDSLPGKKTSVDISHILLQVTPSQESLDNAYQKILKIQEEIKNGGDFAKLAAQYSEDPGSKNSGGDLGFVSRGTFVTEYEEAAFSLKKDEISEIVQSQFGFHIIQLLDRQGERVRTRHILIQVRPTADDETRVKSELMAIRKNILEADSSFKNMAIKYSKDPNAAKDYGHLGTFEKGGFQIPEFEAAVQNLNDGDISEPFKTNFGYHIVRLNKRENARKLSLSRDWEQVEQWALQYKREDEFKKWMEQIRSEIPVVVKLEK